LATIAVVGATAFAVSLAGARSPMEGIGLLAAKYPALAIGVGLCAAACAPAWWGRDLRTTPFDLAALGYGVACALAVAWHSSASPLLLPWLALQVAAFIVVAAACRAAAEGSAALLDGLVVVAALVAVIALYEALGGAMPWEVGRRPGATFGNRNSVGGYCAIAVPLAISRVLQRPSYWRSLALALLVLVVLLCRARSSWVGLLVAGALATGTWLWARRRHPRGAPATSTRGRRLVLTAVIVGAITLEIVPWAGLRWTEDAPLRASFARLLDYESGTGRSRVDQHRLGLAMLASSPALGLGPGAWRREAPRFVHAATRHHTRFVEPLWTPASDLLRHAVETGAVGLAAAAAMVIALLLGGRARIIGASDPTPLALAASLVVAVVLCAFDTPLFRPHSIALIAAVAGALRNESVRGARQLPGRAVAVAAVVGAALCLAITLPRFRAAEAFSRSFSAQTVVELGAAGMLPHEALQAIAGGQRAVDCAVLVPAATLIDRVMPYEPDNLRVLARCAERTGRRPDAAMFLARVRSLEPHDGETARRLRELTTAP